MEHRPWKNVSQGSLRDSNSPSNIHQQWSMNISVIIQWLRSIRRCESVIIIIIMIISQQPSTEYSFCILFVRCNYITIRADCWLFPSEGNFASWFAVSLGNLDFSMDNAHVPGVNVDHDSAGRARIDDTPALFDDFWQDLWLEGVEKFKAKLLQDSGFSTLGLSFLARSQTNAHRLSMIITDPPRHTRSRDCR